MCRILAAPPEFLLFNRIGPLSRPQAWWHVLLCYGMAHNLSTPATLMAYVGLTDVPHLLEPERNSSTASSRREPTLAWLQPAHVVDWAAADRFVLTIRML